MDPMSLEKLTYYAQAFHLALNDTPLFPDEIHAWKWGPVVPAVYKRYAGYGADPIVLPEDHAIVAVGQAASDFLTQVVGFFCQHTAVNLSRATHLEQPWLDANGADNDIISQDAMKFYYRMLMDEGESSLSRHELLDTTPEPRWSSYYIAGICSRRLAEHPFYDGGLAKKLAAPVEAAKPFPKGFFDPVKERDVVEFKRGEDPDEIIKRAVT